MARIKFRTGYLVTFDDVTDYRYAVDERVLYITHTHGMTIIDLDRIEYATIKLEKAT